MNAAIVYGMRLREIEEAGGIEALRVRDMAVEFGHHDFKRYFMDPAVYFEKRPEWFGLRSGVRVGGYRGVCLCLTNREMEEEFARNVADFVEKYSWIERVSVWPDDGLTPCDCEECRRDYSDGRNISDHIIAFVNSIARRFPDIRFTHLVYQATLRQFPLQERPEPNVDFCTIEFEPERLRLWRGLMDHDQPEGERSARLQYIYGYWGSWSGYAGQSRHFPTELSERFDEYVAAGVDGVLTQARFDYPSGGGTTMYLMARLCWEGHEDPDEAVADYCEAGLGKWAPLFEEFFAAIDGLHGSMRRSVMPGYGLAKGFIDAGPGARASALEALRRLVRTYDRFEPALAEVAADAAALIAKERDAFEFNHAAVKAYEQALRAVQTLCLARDMDRGNRGLFVALASEADTQLRAAGRTLQRLGRFSSRLSESARAIMDGHIREIDDLRRSETLIEAGVASFSVLSGDELEVADASEESHAAEPYAYETGGLEESSRQLVFRPSEAGAFIEIELPTPEPGAYTVSARFYREANMGRWRVVVQGRETLEADLYHMAFRMTEYCVGEFDVEGPRLRLRFESAGRNEDAKNAWLAISDITVTRHTVPQP